MYIIILNKEEKEVLRGYVKTSPLKTIRLRAHAILMRDHRMGIKDIAELVFRSESTVTRWMKDFVTRRVGSIFSGMVNNENASKLTKGQREEIRDMIGRPMNEKGIPKEFWDVPKLKEYVNAVFGVEYESSQSYHFLLKFSNLSFKYPDKLNLRRDDNFIEKRVIEIREEIAPLLKDPEWIVLTSDETRLQMEAEIRRAWLVKGERTIVKTQRSEEHQNYLGFLDLRYGVCQVFEIDRGNQIETIRVLEELMRQYPDKKVCIVWDNARWHKGKLLREELSKGHSLEKLHLINFPPYAPDHNPIEHVWQYAKSKIANRQQNTFKENKDIFLSVINSRIFDYKI